MKTLAHHRPRLCQMGWTSDEYTLLRLINLITPQASSEMDTSNSIRHKYWPQIKDEVCADVFIEFQITEEKLHWRERRTPPDRHVPNINVRAEGEEPIASEKSHEQRSQIYNIKILSFPSNTQHFNAHGVWSLVSFINSGNVFSFIFTFIYLFATRHVGS